MDSFNTSRQSPPPACCLFFSFRVDSRSCWRCSSARSLEDVSPTQPGSILSARLGGKFFQMNNKSPSCGKGTFHRSWYFDLRITGSRRVRLQAGLLNHSVKDQAHDSSRSEVLFFYLRIYIFLCFPHQGRMKAGCD